MKFFSKRKSLEILDQIKEKSNYKRLLKFIIGYFIERNDNFQCHWKFVNEPFCL